MSDTSATQARQDVVADVDEIIEHVINGNMLSMPYDVYSELFDAVDGLGVEIENLQSENAKLKELAKLMHRTISALQDTFDASLVYNGVELSAEYFETELNKLGVEVD